MGGRLEAVQFADEAEVYTRIGGFLADLVASPGLGLRLGELETSLAIELENPAARMVLHLSPAGSEVIYGSTSAADGLIQMTSDLADQIFAGSANWFAGINEGTISITDSVRDFLPLLPALEYAAFPRYASVYREASP